MRTFVKLRLLLTSHAELSRKLAALERKYDRHFKLVFGFSGAHLDSRYKASYLECLFHLHSKPGHYALPE